MYNYLQKLSGLLQNLTIWVRKIVTKKILYQCLILFVNYFQNIFYQWEKLVGELKDKKNNNNNEKIERLY